MIDDFSALIPFRTARAQTIHSAPVAFAAHLASYVEDCGSATVVAAVESARGTGKTRAAAQFARYVADHEPQSRVVVLVPSETEAREMRTLLNATLVTGPSPVITVTSSIGRLRGMTIDYLVVDEPEVLWRTTDEFHAVRAMFTTISSPTCGGVMLMIGSPINGNILRHRTVKRLPSVTLFDQREPYVAIA